MSYEALMDDIKKLSQEQFEFVFEIVENLPKKKNFTVNEKVADKTKLSAKRRKFLETAGNIDIDEEAIEDLRTRSMI